MSRRPNRFAVPIEVADRHASRLKVQLRRLYLQFRRGELSQAEIKTLGVVAITEEYSSLIEDLKSHFERRGLVWGDTEAELHELLDEKLREWRSIVYDM